MTFKSPDSDKRLDTQIAGQPGLGAAVRAGRARPKESVSWGRSCFLLSFVMRSMSRIGMQQVRGDMDDVSYQF